MKRSPYRARILLLIAMLSMSQILRSLPAFSADLPSNTGTQVSISLSNTDLPASDLVYVDGSGHSRILSPDEAWQLKKQNGLDLSKLDPDPTTDIWKDGSTEADEAADAALPIQAGDTAGFFGVITAPNGHFKFNVQIQPPGLPAQTLTFMISKDLHTFLLRKELLRQLGYRIPAMKYLSRVKIEFPDAFTRDFFLRTEVTSATFGVASRWCSVAPELLKQDKTYPCTALASETDPLRVTLQDVVAMEATPLYYNVALGPPIDVIPGTETIRPENPRILRALAIPYGLANISESINQVDWHVGRVQNGAYQFSTTDEANFSCSLDDALWMSRRIAALTRADFARMVANAYYPGPVAQVLVEKLSARRDSLDTAFGVNTPLLAYNPKITQLPALKNGKIVQEDWPGYASRFAWGDPESPLKGLQWYVFSEVQSNVMEALLSKANAAIPQLTIASQSAAHAQSIEQTLNQYFNSGVAQTIPLGVWAAPLVGGGIDLSRSVVLGNYMGTNNLVQLVDNFGFNVNVGVMIGVDGLPAVLGAQGLIQATDSIEVTHIKPLQKLKSAVTEPLRNELVPLIMRSASDIFREATALGAGAPTGATAQTPEQLKKALADTMDKLKNYLGVGESIILTENLTGIQKLGINVGLQVDPLPGAGIEGDINELMLSRLHIFRKDQNTIQVFKDNGQLVGAHVAFEATLDQPAAFPIISLSAQKVTGSARSKIFTLNINPDPRVNPGIYTSATALASALRTGSVEVLEGSQKPTRVATKFTESQTSVQFFHLMRRTLKTNGRVSVQLPDGTQGDYISLSGGRQTGAHYQLLATQAATYLTQKILSDTTVGINTQAAPDPGHSFLGHSQTQSTELQARLDKTGLSVPMVRMQSRWEGWNITAKDAIQLVNGLSAKFGFQLYPDGFLMDTTNVKLYEIDLYVNLYESAFAQLLAMTPAQLTALENKTHAQYHCHEVMLPLINSAADRSACESLEKFTKALATYRNARLDAGNQAINLYNLVLDLEQFVQFKDLVQLVGADHMYVYSTINGFRIGSETLSDPIRSNTLGKVDPNNPDGILDAVEQILGVDDGEFKMQWIRGVL